MNTTTAAQQRTAAKEFANFWKGKGYEKGQTQPFWLDLLKILGVADPERGFIEFKDKAHIDAAHGFIDGYIPPTRVLVEQKSLGKSLRAGIPHVRMEKRLDPDKNHRLCAAAVVQPGTGPNKE